MAKFACCMQCRLVQSPTRTCSDCGGVQLVAPALLTKPIVSGLTTVAKQPAKGWRDSVALLVTTFGVLVGMVGGAVVSHGSVVAGAVGAGAFAMAGYTKQFWRTAFKRGTRVSTVKELPRPAEGERITGEVKVHEHRVGDAVAIAVTYLFDDEVIARKIESVPFWIVEGDRRVLVDGVLRIATAKPHATARLTAVSQLAELGIAIRRADRSRISMSRIELRPDDRVTATGTVAAIQLADGYRDHLVDSVVGEAGRPVAVAVL